MLVAGTIAPTRRAFAELLAEARARTIVLVTPLSREEMTRRPEASVNSVLAELERIVRFEEKWLLDSNGDWRVSSYDEWFDVMMGVRQRVLENLEMRPEEDRVSAGERYRTVLEHEYRRGEAILETLQAAGDPYTPLQRRPLPRGRRLADPGFMTRFSGGPVRIGETEESVWPEERPSHRVELEPFWIDVVPVTNGD